MEEQGHPMIRSIWIPARLSVAQNLGQGMATATQDVEDSENVRNHDSGIQVMTDIDRRSISARLCDRRASQFQ
jgi:hypothetical protein